MSVLSSRVGSSFRELLDAQNLGLRAVAITGYGLYHFKTLLILFSISIAHPTRHRQMVKKLRHCHTINKDGDFHGVMICVVVDN